MLCLGRMGLDLFCVASFGALYAMILQGRTLGVIDFLGSFASLRKAFDEVLPRIFTALNKVCEVIAAGRGLHYC